MRPRLRDEDQVLRLLQLLHHRLQQPRRRPHQLSNRPPRKPNPRPRVRLLPNRHLPYSYRRQPRHKSLLYRALLKPTRQLILPPRPRLQHPPTRMCRHRHPRKPVPLSLLPHKASPPSTSRMTSMRVGHLRGGVWSRSYSQVTRSEAILQVRRSRYNTRGKQNHRSNRRPGSW